MIWPARSRSTNSPGPGLAHTFPPLRLPAATDRIELPGATVDFRLEEVRDGSGAHVELRPRSFVVLRHLASRAGELVTKDDLLAECWPGVVVTEDSLASASRRSAGRSARAGATWSAPCRAAATPSCCPRRPSFRRL